MQSLRRVLRDSPETDVRFYKNSTPEISLKFPYFMQRLGYFLL